MSFEVFLKHSKLSKQNSFCEFNQKTKGTIFHPLGSPFQFSANVCPKLQYLLLLHYPLSSLEILPSLRDCGRSCLYSFRCALRSCAWLIVLPACDVLLFITLLPFPPLVLIIVDLLSEHLWPSAASEHSLSLLKYTLETYFHGFV